MRSGPLAIALMTMGVTNLAQAGTAETVEVGGTEKLDEVVVTANRREENLQKSPVTVIALSAEQLVRDGVKSFTDLTGQVPSLNVGSDGMVFLRGFGNTDTREEGAPTVSVYQDGVYSALPWYGAAVPYDDIARVEVLTGPQGTLFGRNSTAGAINAITNAPKLGVLEGEAWATVGNYNAKNIGGVINVPMGDKAALRVVGSSDTHDFYNPDPTPGPKHGNNNKDVQSIRATLVIEATDDLKITLRGSAISDKSLRGNFGINNATLGNHPTNFNSKTPFGLSSRGEYRTATAQFDWRIGPGTLTYLGNYTDTSFFNDNRLVNADDSYLRLFQNIDTNSNQNELRYSGEVDRFKFVAGLFQFHMKQAVDVGIPERLNIGLPSGPGFFSFEQQPQKEDSKAAYGQVTWAATDRINLTAGLRSSRERKERDGKNVFRYSFDAVQPQFYYGPYDESKTVVTGINYARGKWSSTDWKLGFDIQVAPSHMVYGNVGTGFKTGGYDDGINRTFKPEHVLTYEVGSKNRFFDDSLQLNAVLYRSNYKDLQITGTGIDAATGLRYAATVNAAKAHATGLEVDLQARPTKDDHLALTFAIMDAKNGDFPTGSLGDTWHTTDFNYKGFRLRAAPKVTGTVSYGHDFEFADDGVLTPELKIRYVSSQYMHYTNFPISYQGSYTKSDFTVTYRKGIWEARAFVHNIENKVVYSYISPNNPPTTGWYYLQDPRTVGFGVRVKFQ